MSRLRSRSVPIASLVFAIGVLLPGLAAADPPATERASVVDKLTRYLLNADHPEGGSKAKWFKDALGFTKANMGELASQIRFDSASAIETGKGPHGIKFNQTISIKGANGKVIPVTFAWIKNTDGVTRLVTSIPTKGPGGVKPTETKPAEVKPAAERVRLTPTEEARRTFQALDALADTRAGEGRTLTPTEVTQQKRSGGAGRIAQDLLGEKAPTGTYTQRTTPAASDPAAPRKQGKVPSLDSARFSRPGPLNQFLQSPLSKPELDKLYSEALTKQPGAGPAKLSNGQTWFVDRATGEFKPLSGPGVVQLTAPEVKHLQKLRKALLGGANPTEALQRLSRDMAKAGTQLTPEMARALKAIGQTNDFLPDEIAAALEKQMPKLDRVQGATKEMVAKAETVANGRAFKILKYGGRTLLVVAIAADAYEIYVAEDKARATTKVVSGWGGALAAGGAAGTYMSPSLFAGPWGWVAYGATVAGAGVLGYIVGENVGEVVYDSVFTKAGGSQ